ncbi:MAG: hypothetical protein Ct9H300mP1_07720 [Planctomycetaceae bacterium]|nr:MAG: hypothetical protein Ct9H300mP1_07720 [Planctomycetaceae bacterium]
MDTYFHAADGRLKLREIEAGGRCFGRVDLVRTPGNPVAARTSQFHVVFPFHGRQPFSKRSTRGVGVQVVVRKVRRLFLLDNVRIHLDEVDGLGNFLEFEGGPGPPGGTRPRLRAVWGHFQSEFGIATEAIIGASYSDLLRQAESTRYIHSRIGLPPDQLHRSAVRRVHDQVVRDAKFLVDRRGDVVAVVLVLDHPTPSPSVSPRICPGEFPPRA